MPTSGCHGRSAPSGPDGSGGVPDHLVNHSEPRCATLKLCCRLNSCLPHAELSGSLGALKRRHQVCQTVQRTGWARPNRESVQQVSELSPIVMHSVFHRLTHTSTGALSAVRVLWSATVCYPKHRNSGQRFVNGSDLGRSTGKSASKQAENPRVERDLRFVSRRYIAQSTVSRET